MPTEFQHNEQALAALIDYIDHERKRRRAGIIEAAEQEARELVRTGLAEARRRVHEVIEQQRQERRSRLRATHATEQGRIREREHEIVRERLGHAWQSLEQCLEQRWQQAGTRMQWLRAALGSAARHLPGGHWRLEHPGECDRQELDQALAELREHRGDVEIEPVRSDEVVAGLRVRAGTAMLDATVAALLDRRSHVEGLLLGALQSTEGIPAGNARPEDET